MAYTDFENVAAPGFWDETRSGFHDGGLSSGDRYGALSALAPLRDAALATRWAAGAYAAGGGEDYHRALFVLPTAMEVSEVFIDCFTDSYTPGIAVWLGSGASMAGSATDPVNWSAELVDELPADRQVYRFVFPEPTVVSAISFGGSGEYPQGTPLDIFGIYGLALTGALPPPFWREFSNTYELR